MALIRLNNQMVLSLMAKNLLRPVDIAKALNVSKQMAHYIVHRGGMQYAGKLADIFNCKRTDLLVSVPSPVLQGATVVNGRVRKSKERRK